MNWYNSCFRHDARVGQSFLLELTAFMEKRNSLRALIHSSLSCCDSAAKWCTGLDPVMMSKLNFFDFSFPDG